MTITDQVLLAGGWRDAWRHELRGPHGEWVKGEAVPENRDIMQGGGQTPRLDKEATNQAILDQATAAKGRGQMLGIDSPMADKVFMALNRAAASWEADDHAEAIRQLLIASREETKRGGKGTGLHANTYRVMAARIRASDEWEAEVSRPVRKEAGKASRVMGKILGGGKDTGIGWNGSVETWPDDDLAHSGIAGLLEWNGTLGLQEQIATDIDRDVRLSKEPILNPRSWQVLEHEMTHATIPVGRGYDAGASDYQEPGHAAIEEGFTELGAIQHAGEFFTAMGIADRQTTETGPGDDLTDAVKDFNLQALYDNQAELRDIFDHAGRIEYGGMDTYNALNDAMHTLWSPGQPSGLVIGEELSRAYNAAIAPAVLSRAPESRQVADEINSFMAKIGIKPVGSRNLTMAELADSRNDPAVIMDHSPWGAYYGQVVAAQKWVQDIAKAEGHADLRKGTDGWKRTIELADEINREDAGTKPMALARQALRAAGVEATDAKARGLAWEITHGWTDAIAAAVSPYTGVGVAISRIKSGGKAA